MVIHKTSSQEKDILWNLCLRMVFQKKAVLDYLQTYRRTRGLEYVALILGNVYGPRQNAKQEGGTISRFATQMMKRTSNYFW